MREAGEPRRAYWFLGALMSRRSVKWGKKERRGRRREATKRSKGFIILKMEKMHFTPWESQIFFP